MYSCIPGWPQTDYVAKNYFELILLPLLSSAGLQAYTTKVVDVLRIKPQALCM